MLISQLEECNIPIKRMQKTSLLVFLGVFIHNLPEGMATFISTIKDIELGILLAFAIAIHNIPEGIAVAVPIYTCTGSRKKAIFWSFLSGMSEFLGVIVVGFIILPFYSDYLIGAMLAMVAGFMIYVSLDELVPSVAQSNHAAHQQDPPPSAASALAHPPPHRHHSCHTARPTAPRSSTATTPASSTTKAPASSTTKTASSSTPWHDYYSFLGLV